MTRKLLSVCLGSLALVRSAALDAQTVGLEVDAGRFDRINTPVSVEVPKSLRGAAALIILRDDGGVKHPVEVQRDASGSTIHWIVRDKLAAGSKRSYTLMAGELPKSAKPGASYIECTNDGSALLFRSGGRRLLQYNTAIVKPPGKPDPLYDRSGYIHPVWTPSGRVMTNDFPPAHKHHHGIWFPWTNTTFEGRKVDFWNSKKAEGRIEHTGLDTFGAGSVFGWFRVGHRFLDLKAPGGPKAVLSESWDVRIYAIADYYLFAIVSVQNAVTDAPLELKKYRYGGMGFRGSGQWEGPGDNCKFLTSEGKTRKDGHATTARWCEVYGIIDGAPAGTTILCHPSNFRFPQNMRIHPSEPFFNWSPCQAGDFKIEKGKPYVSRYRYYVHDGDVDAKVSERLWNDYASPPKVTVK